MMMEAAVAVDAGSRRRRSWSGGRPAAGAVVKSEGGRRDMMLMDGFSISSASATPVFWNSRRRPSVHLPRSRKVTDDDGNKSPTANPATATAADDESDGKNGSGSDAPVNNASSAATSSVEDAQALAEAEKNLLELSERRKALFEPLDPADGPNGRRFLAEELLPPPDFDSVSYPKGWLVGKKRKLVNVDVVESMRRIAVLEMNRKDREIDGLNEQLQEDAQCLERLQVQLLEERSRRADVERENAMLKSQVALLMDMLQEAEEAAGRDGMEEEVIVEEEDNGGNNRSL